MNPLVHSELDTYLRHLIETHIPANPAAGKHGRLNSNDPLKQQQEGDAASGSQGDHR